jgi:hypothetical protein
MRHASGSRAAIDNGLQVAMGRRVHRVPRAVKASTCPRCTARSPQLHGRKACRAATSPPNACSDDLASTIGARIEAALPCRPSRACSERSRPQARSSACASASKPHAQHHHHPSVDSSRGTRYLYRHGVDAPPRGAFVDRRETPSDQRRRALDQPGSARRQCAPRRSARVSAHRTAGDPAFRSLQARSARTELRFRLQYHRRGLYVEREESTDEGPHCVQSLRFEDVQHFRAWCDADPARFDHPLLHAALKREAAALWPSEDAADA